MVRCRWYTKATSPVPTCHVIAFGTPTPLLLYQPATSSRLVHQRPFSCTKLMVRCRWYTKAPSPVPTCHIFAFGTPKPLLLYQTYCPMPLVHQSPFSCTNLPHIRVWYTKTPSPVPNLWSDAVGTPGGSFRYQPTNLIHQLIRIGQTRNKATRNKAPILMAIHPGSILKEKCKRPISAK